ncbi:Glutaredoxin-like protein, partial [Actinidia chinensis var. chinensis]
MAIAFAARPFSPLVALTRRRAQFNALASYSAQPISSSSAESRKLILYSKPGCCLCDGLKEKLHAAFSLSGPDPLQDVDLQIRDITTNSDWERAYQYEIPVLARVLPDGTE